MTRSICAVVGPNVLCIRKREASTLVGAAAGGGGVTGGGVTGGGVTGGGVTGGGDVGGGVPAVGDGAAPDPLDPPQPTERKAKHRRTAK